MAQDPPDWATASIMWDETGERLVVDIAEKVRAQAAGVAQAALQAGGEEPRRLQVVAASHEMDQVIDKIEARGASINK